MGKIVVLVLLLLFGGWWIFHGGRRMTEESINRQYATEGMALAQLDSQFLCDQLASDYRDEGISFTLSGTQRHSFGKEEACEHMKELFRDLKRVNALSRGAIGMSFEHHVVSVELSDDRKIAEVEAVGTVHMAGRLISKTHYFDTVIRRYGRIKHASSQSKSWVYVPAGN